MRRLRDDRNALGGDGRNRAGAAGAFPDIPFAPRIWWKCGERLRNAFPHFAPTSERSLLPPPPRGFVPRVLIADERC
jgi:hypothetical protein